MQIEIYFIGKKPKFKRMKIKKTAVVPKVKDIQGKL